MENRYYWNNKYTEYDDESSDCASQMSEDSSRFDDTYQTNELNGKLYGKVMVLKDGFGFIRPEKKLPKAYKKKIIYFHDSKVEGPKLRAKSDVCFKLNLRSHEKPNVNWVKLRSREVMEEINDHDVLLEPDGLMLGRVVKVNRRFGFVKPDGVLPPPYPTERNIYFPTPEGTGGIIHQGQQVAFTLKREGFEKPSVAQIFFADINYDPICEVPKKHNLCGHIYFEDTFHPNFGVPCQEACMKPLSCGHTCTRKCSEKCFKICTSCHENNKQKRKMYNSSELEGILYGHVESIDDGFGYVKPARDLPPPFNPRRNIYFITPEDAENQFSEGHPAVFTLNIAEYEKHSVAEIAFPGISYDPHTETSYKHHVCGHICFKQKHMKKDNVCFKQCRNVLECGHECLRYCSEECTRECTSCYEKRKRGEQTYTPEDLDGLLHGTVVNVKEQYGFVKADRLLPNPYNTKKDIFFTIPPDGREHVEIGQRAVFILNKERYDRTSVTDIAFATDLTDSEPVSFFYVPGERVPFIHADCGHICFWNEDADDMELCLRNCPEILSCGHPCQRQCHEQCLRECPPCHKRSEKKRKESEVYKASDLDGFLYGTIVTVKENFGFVKPERGLPTPYNSRKEIYFSADDNEIAGVSQGQLAVFMLKKDSQFKPAAYEIAFIEKGVDRSTVKPFIREECGHICFTMVGGTQGSCLKNCYRKLPCGHSCNRNCSDLCPSLCDECKGISSRAEIFFSCDTNSVQIGHVTFVGEGHGYIKPNGSLPCQSKQKTGVYFSFDETNAEHVKKGLMVVFVLKQQTAEKPEASQLAVVDKDNHHFQRINMRPRSKARQIRLNGEMVVEKLEVEAANSASNELLSYHLVPKRELNVTDPMDLNFRIAESQFLRFAQKSGKQYELESVTYYVNPQLVRRFRAKRAAFEKMYGKGERSRDVLAFHGTREHRIDNIIRENFKLEYCQRNLYGKGIYLSEFPQVSIDFGRSLLLCKVLPGNSCDVTNSRTDAPIGHGYNSNRVNADEDGYGWALVVQNPDQILPCYVINYKEITRRSPSPTIIYRNIPAQPRRPPSPVWKPPSRPHSYAPPKSKASDKSDCIII